MECANLEPGYQVSESQESQDRPGTIYRLKEEISLDPVWEPAVLSVLLSDCFSRPSNNSYLCIFLNLSPYPQSIAPSASLDNAALLALNRAAFRPNFL